MIAAAVLVGLVAYRIWRFVALDLIMSRPREWIGERGPRYAWWLHHFIECPWCLGTWLAAAVTFTGYFLGYVEDWLVVWLASSVIVGLIGDRT